MDSGNTSNWTNGSSVVQNILNDTFDSGTNQPKPTEDVPIVVSLLCLLGLPGNVLVMTVYVRKMTTSTRVYLFALVSKWNAAIICYKLRCQSDDIRRASAMFREDVRKSYRQTRVNLSACYHQTCITRKLLGNRGISDTRF